MPPMDADRRHAGQPGRAWTFLRVCNGITFTSFLTFTALHLMALITEREYVTLSLYVAAVGLVLGVGHYSPPRWRMRALALALVVVAAVGVFSAARRVPPAEAPPPQAPAASESR